MSQRTTGLYRLTQIPSFYAVFQNILGGERSRRELVSRYIQPGAGDRILDIGCGSATLLPDLGDVSYTGIDLNSRHIAAAKERFGARASFYCCDVASLATVAPGPYDRALCMGVLHHLEDATIDDLGRSVVERLTVGGRLVTVDPAFVDGQSPIARWLAARDSGQCVRTPDGYAARLRAVFAKIEVIVRHDLLRVPYTHCIMVATKG